MIFGRTKTASIFTAFAMLFLLGGCFDLLNDKIETIDSPILPIDDNLPPSIAGTPGSSIKVGEFYTFTPTASDPNGDVLEFDIQNKPLWVDFNSDTGNVSGVPGLGDAGTYGNISISVSDGKASSTLPLFSVSVNQIGTGSVSLSWTPPTLNADGTPLTDLAGYVIYYGVSLGDYPNQIRIDNSGISTYIVDNLSPNTYYFASASFNVAGIESDLSNVAVKAVN